MADEPRHPTEVGMEVLGIEPTSPIGRRVLQDAALHAAVYTVGQYHLAAMEVVEAVRRDRNRDLWAAAYRLRDAVDPERQRERLAHAVRVTTLAQLPGAVDQARRALGLDTPPS